MRSSIWLSRCLRTGANDLQRCGRLSSRPLLNRSTVRRSLHTSKPALPFPIAGYSRRFTSTAVSSTTASPTTSSTPSSHAAPNTANTLANTETPSYQLTFTCKPCTHRSTHRITKQGYHHGTVLITCPQCHNRHIISDHLKIFMDRSGTLEDILARKAAPGTDLSKLIRKGRLVVPRLPEGEKRLEGKSKDGETKRASNSSTRNTNQTIS